MEETNSQNIRRAESRMCKTSRTPTHYRQEAEGSREVVVCRVLECGCVEEEAHRGSKPVQQRPESVKEQQTTSYGGIQRTRPIYSQLRGLNKAVLRGRGLMTSQLPFLDDSLWDCRGGELQKKNNLRKAGSSHTYFLCWNRIAACFFFFYLMI